MTNLTDRQMSVLASACERADGIADRPETVNRTAALRIAAKLIERKLLKEVPAKLGQPIWRTDERGRAFSLKISKAGRALVQPTSCCTAHAGKEVAPQLVSGAAKGLPLPAGAAGEGASGRKRDVVVALMQRENGASIDDLMAATGWLAHSTRAALTGLRKAGFAIERCRDPDNQTSLYRIASSGAAAVA